MHYLFESSKSWRKSTKYLRWKENNFEFLGHRFTSLCLLDEAGMLQTALAPLKVPCDATSKLHIQHSFFESGPVSVAALQSGFFLS